MYKAQAPKILLITCSAFLAFSSPLVLGQESPPEEGNQTTQPSRVEPPTMHTVWMERIDRLRKMDLRELARELGRAQRIDRTGQNLLKRRAVCRVAISQAELMAAKLASLSAVQRATEVLARPEVAQRLAEVRNLPPEKLVLAYAEFLDEHRLDQGTMEQCRHLRLSKQSIDRGRKKLLEIEQQINNYERRGRLDLPDFQIRRGRPWEILDELDRETAGSSEREPEFFDQRNAKRVADFLDSLTKPVQEEEPLRAEQPPEGERS